MASSLVIWERVVAVALSKMIVCDYRRERSDRERSDRVVMHSILSAASMVDSPLPAQPGAGHFGSPPHTYVSFPSARLFATPMAQRVNVTLDGTSSLINYTPAGAWFDGDTTDPFWQS